MRRGSPYQTSFGFDEMHTHIGSSVSADDYGRWLRDRGGDDRRSTGLGAQPTDARPWHREESEHPSNWTTKRALEFLERRDPDRPFFLTVSYVRPHAPLDPPRAYWDQYIVLDLPDPVMGNWVDRLHADQRHVSRFVREEPTRRADRMRAAYYALITHIDHQLNRILEGLQWEHEVRGETVIVFTAVHGEMLGDHRHWAKQALYEGAARVPMLVDLPEGVGPDQAVGPIDRPVGLEDVTPTMLELAGAEVPDTVEGQSLLDVIADPNASAHRSFYHGETGSQPASHFLAGEDTKKIWFSEQGEALLFDVAADPLETTDLSRDPAQRATIERYRPALADRLADRPEGFVRDARLTPLAAE